MLTTNEKLAVLTAMSKQVKAALDEVRKEAEEQMAERFESEGVDRARLMLDGEEVGSVAVKSDRKGWEVCDQDAYDEFLRDHALTWMPRFAEKTASEARLPFYRAGAHLLAAIAGAQA